MSTGEAHPLASQPVLGAIELNPALDAEDRVQIVGDLIVWTIIGESTDVSVYNWKTGLQVWQDGYWVRLSQYKCC